jgi:hypothetical protein
VSEITWKDAAAVQLKLTAVVPVKFAPESVTVVPAGPLAGEKELITGAPFPGRRKP